MPNLIVLCINTISIDYIDNLLFLLNIYIYCEITKQNIIKFYHFSVPAFVILPVTSLTFEFDLEGFSS